MTSTDSESFISVPTPTDGCSLADESTTRTTMADISIYGDKCIQITPEEIDEILAPLYELMNRKGDELKAFVLYGSCSIMTMLGEELVKTSNKIVIQLENNGNVVVLNKTDPHESVLSRFRELNTPEIRKIFVDGNFNYPKPSDEVKALKDLGNKYFYASVVKLGDGSSSSRSSSRPESCHVQAVTVSCGKRYDMFLKLIKWTSPSLVVLVVWYFYHMMHVTDLELTPAVAPAAVPSVYMHQRDLSIQQVLHVNIGEWFKEVYYIYHETIESFKALIVDFLEAF